MNSVAPNIALARLTEILGGLDRPLAVAFSGGVDSSCLLAVAARVVPTGLVAITGVSPSLSHHQLEQARRVAGSLGVRHVELATDELADDRYASNPVNRCYFCKNELHGRIAERFGGAFIVADGNNADDGRASDRPGMAAGRERGVISPLLDAGLSKEDVRRLSRELGLETADYPAMPCLSSRIPHGHVVTDAKLAQVEAAEAAVRDLGFVEFRVRHLGEAARVELGAGETGRRAEIEAAVEATGFASVVVDDRPLSSGRLHRESRE